MVSIDFLNNLRTKHRYSNVYDDLTFIMAFFDYDKLDDFFKSQVSMGAKDFLKNLEKDFFACSPSKRDVLVSVLEKWKYSTTNSYLLAYLEKLFTKYIINHPREYDVFKFAPIIVASTYRDISSNLSHRSSLQITKGDETALADVAFLGNTFTFHFYEKTHENFKGSPELFLYQILSELYHEEYHAYVAERNLDPTCYNKDILIYQLTGTVKKILSDILLDKKGLISKGSLFYHDNWENMDEEIDACLKGTAKAHDIILEMNPNFDFALIQANILVEQKNLLKQKNQQFFKIGRFKEVYKLDYLLDILDKYLPLYNEYVQGILSKMYDKKGNRKSLETLLIEAEEAPSNIEREEVSRFYDELIYYLIKKNYPINANNAKVMDALNRKEAEYLTILKSLTVNTILDKVSNVKNSLALQKELEFISNYKKLIMTKNSENQRNR